MVKFHQFHTPTTYLLRSVGKTVDELLFAQTLFHITHGRTIRSQKKERKRKEISHKLKITELK